MEYNSYLAQFGKLVSSIRRNSHMSQIEFYNFLFPGNNKNEENIKKKMHQIENGKQKSLDLEFLLTLCHKCNVSADYVLGINEDYSNHALEFICEYTGLEEKAAKQLHEWNLSKNNGSDISKIDEAYFGDEGEIEHQRMNEKQTGTQFLKIINYLFKEGERKNQRGYGKKGAYSNLRVLHSLYVLCMSKPEIIMGFPIYENDIDETSAEEYYKQSSGRMVRLDATETLMMQDSSKVWYPIFTKSILEQIARNHLMKALDQLIDQVKNEQ